MSGNTIGRSFCVTTFGESHGPAIGAIVDGCPPGLELAESDIQADLEPRRTGTSQYTSQRQEPDQVKILSGVFEGRTTGTAIGLLVDNVDAALRATTKRSRTASVPAMPTTPTSRSTASATIAAAAAPLRAITVATVAAGAIARKWLREQLGITVAGLLSQVGPHRLDCVDAGRSARESVLLRRPEPIAAARGLSRGSCAATAIPSGARVTVRASGVPPGLGEPMFDRLDADIAYAMMGINAAKAVEIGDGVAVAGQRGYGASRRADARTGSLRTMPAARSAASARART